MRKKNVNVSKREQMIFAPEGTLLCLPEYEIRVTQARDGYAVFLLKKASKKLRGVKYETMSIDDPLEDALDEILAGDTQE